MDGTVTAAIDLVEAAVGDASILSHLFQLYSYDFTDFEARDVAEDGLFPNGPAEPSIVDPRRHPFIVRVSGRLGGFAIVDEGSRISDDGSIVDMGEFFVMRRYRRQGVGREVAFRLFDAYRAIWEVRQLPRNIAAQAFWRRIIGEYTSHTYEEFVAPDGDVTQRFDSRFRTST